MKYFRMCEERLDEHHKTLGLWEMPRGQAIYGVLTVLEFVFCSLDGQGPAASSEIGRMCSRYKVRDAVIQAVRWLCVGFDDVVVESTSDGSIVGASGEFMNFAREYAAIADLHMMQGRGLARVEVDEEEQVVTFHHMGGPGLSVAARSYELCGNHRQHADELEVAVQGKEEGFLDAVGAVEYRPIEGRVSLKGLTREVFELAKPFIEELVNIERMEIDENEDLVGFNAGEYRAFCRAVVTWSGIALAGHRGMVAAGIPHEECMPIQIVNSREFIDVVSKGVGLAVEKIGAILERLRYCPGDKSDVVMQPFLVGGENIAWSPSLFNEGRHERNMLKSMARAGGALKVRADNLIGGRERKFLERIGDCFKPHGYQYQILTDIDAGGDSTDVDILLYKNAKPEEVLLVEGKTILPPDEVNEVNDATIACQTGQKQLRVVQNILGLMSVRRKAELFKCVDWARIKDVLPVVILTEGEPHIQLDHGEIPVITYDILRSRLRSCDFSSPEHFWSACVGRGWLQDKVAEGKFFHREITVGAITYRIPGQKI